MPEQPTIYFAYGSNLSLAQMAKRCPAARAIGRALAKGYRLAFPRPSDTWRGGVAGIVPVGADDDGGAPGYYVEGAAYELTEACIAALDEYEGLLEERAHYWRATIDIVLIGTGERAKAMTYFANPEGEGRFDPHADYVRVMIDGARDHGLGVEWVAMLEAMLEAAPSDPSDAEGGGRYEV